MCLLWPRSLLKTFPPTSTIAKSNSHHHFRSPILSSREPLEVENPQGREPFQIASPLHGDCQKQGLPLEHPQTQKPQLGQKEPFILLRNQNSYKMLLAEAKR